jgi:flagellar hook-length control protein FliK
MQFSLLNLLNGPSDLLTLLANPGQSGGGKEQGVGAEAFAELLGDIGAAGGDMQQGQQQTGGDLAQELVANLTVAQEIDGVPVTDTVDVSAIKELLGQKISPEEAKQLLAQMDADARNGEQPPEGLRELLEAVEAGGEDVVVQDMLAQVPEVAADDAVSEPRQNTLQRMMQWLQGTLNPGAAPLEALAYANAAAMFQDAEAASIVEARGKEEAQRPEDLAELVSVFMPMSQQSEMKVEALPEVDLPEGDFSMAAPVEEAPQVADAPILVATKHNTPTHAVAGGKTDVMQEFVVDLSAEEATVANVDAAAPVTHDADTQTTLVTQTQQQTASPEARATDHARAQHANLAYQRSEVMDQVHVGVRHAIRDGVDRITIQLNPHELGRVEVKMDIVADGMSQISFLVDKQETFDLLQRDARTLERMLQDAGVRADAGSMEFNLRQDGQSKEPWEQHAADHHDGESKAEISSNHINPSELPTNVYLHLVSDRVDIRA